MALSAPAPTSNGLIPKPIHIHFMLADLVIKSLSRAQQPGSFLLITSRVFKGILNEIFSPDRVIQRQPRHGAGCLRCLQCRRQVMSVNRPESHTSTARSMTFSSSRTLPGQW